MATWLFARRSFCHADGEACTILTTAANNLIKRLHDRMPVILHREEFDLWLSREVDDVKSLAELFHPYPSNNLGAYVVARDVNSPSYDEPGCIIPA